ncbi:hypothetical protein AWH48_16830 [Domibacillus aminovorans]|uniref:PKD/Chitinase domain-containing protein n=1 Tax=Domibacillus aminovorans TaxID=29332 RepID=A0A177KZQ5_9BACI|nr:PKD domain-containing protein [Domibacillus aminovorans]OAH58662.1 hypothetical protein AWH48_16830 [Domibacillus aminovorans]
MNHKLFQTIFFIITILCLFIPTLPASALDVNEPDIKKMSSWKNPKSTEFYTIGITKKDDYLYYSNWKVRVDNSEKGSMVLMRSKDNPEAGLTFAHPSQVSQWAGFFNGNKDYVGQQALTSIKQTFGSHRVDRAYSRDIARYSGAKIDITAGSYDENGYRDAIVEIKTTKYPEATLVPKVTTIEKGVPLSINVSGKQFSPYKEELTWTLYADSTRLDGGTLSSSTLSKDVSRVFSSCGVKELKLTVTDEVQRSTVKTVNVNVTGCATPPPLGQPALTIEPSTQEIMVGDTASFTANYFDASGNKTVVTTHSGATWSAVNSAVAQPGTKGQFVGNSVGTSEVSVTYSGLTAKATVIVSATPPEPEPEPIPNLDPEVEIQGPVVVRAGEEFCLHASASDRDGEIISYDWNYNAIGSLWGQTGCGLYYNKEGEKTVQVTVTDDAGGTASDTHTILVVPPTPIADFKQEGALKENRKWTVTDTTSTPVKFPIVEEKWTIEAVDPANNVPEIIKYKGSLTEDKVIDILMKKEGKYKVTRFVRNSYSDPDKNWNEKIVEYTVRPDEKPTADFATVTAKLRDDVKERPALSQTRVSVQDDSGSNDDFIGQRVWSYQFDSNNDGKFDSNDDDPVIFSDGNEETPYFDTNKVGKYKIGLLAIEEFAQPTIEEFVTEADRRRDDTSDKPSSESVVEVKNIRPVVSYDVKGKKTIDLQLDATDSPYTRAMIETAFNEEIVPKLDAEGYKVNLDWLEKKTGSSVSKMAMGDEHTSVILENGEVWSTGYNINGQLGNGTKTYSNVPVKMSLPVGRSAVSIAAGNNHTSVLLDNGEVWNVGDNFYGQLGDGTKTDRSIPTKMSLPAGRSAVSIAAGGNQTSVILENGEVWGVGTNGSGQLGNGATSNSSVPVRMLIPSGRTATMITIGASFTSVLLDNGEVWGVGANGYGQLGNGTTTMSLVLVKMTLPVDRHAVSIAAGGRFMSVLLDNGEVWNIGENNYGQIGIGSSLTTIKDLSKMTLPTGQSVVSISAGPYQTNVTLDNGEVWSAGYNYTGALGNGTDINAKSAVKMMLPAGRSAMSAAGGFNRTSVTLDNGEVWSTGHNTTGQLGNGTTTNSKVPVKMTLPSKAAFSTGVVKDTKTNFGSTNNYLFAGLVSDKEVDTDAVSSSVKDAGGNFIGLGNLINKAQIESIVDANNGKGTYLPLNDNVNTMMESVADYMIAEMNKKDETTIVLQVGLNDTPYTKEQLDEKFNEILDPKLNEEQIKAKIEFLEGNYFGFSERKNILFGTIFSRQAMDVDQLAASVLGADADFIGVGNSTSKPTIDQVVQKNMAIGTFINDASIDTTVNAMADYIIERVNHRINSNELYVTLEDTVTYKTFYSDYENDPLFSERWKYMHTPDVFENNMGVDPKAHKYLTLPIEQFTRVGKYQPLYSGRDNPVHWDNNAFDTYRLWAKDADNWFIYAHRKPIPDFNFTIDNISGAYSVTNKAFDLDKSSIEIGNGPGIRKQTFHWRVEGEKTWKAGLPTGNLEQKVYEVKNTVVDFQRRTESMIKKMDATGINKPPVAVFEPIPSVITVGQDILFKNLSWDPNGDPLTAQWAIKKKGEPDSAYTALSTDYEPTKNFTAQGEYTVRLIVRDPSNETDSTTRDISVMANNTKPNAGFTYPNPVYIGDTIQIESTATDPDGDLLSYTYEIEKQNGDTVTIQSGDLEMDSNGNVMLPADQFPSDLGKWIITQTVSDGQVEDTATGELTVLDQTIEGFVNHTQKWEENRQKYNFDRTGSANSPRTPDVFFPGEKFMLKANATNTADTVRVKIVGIPGYETVMTNNASGWTGSLWRDDMLKRFKNMDGETLTFEFTSTYSNGWIRTDKVNIIIDDEEYWQQHTTF